MNRIPLAEPYLPTDGREWEYVKDALDSGYLMAGPYVERLEAAFAERPGRRFALACASGTAALHVALLVAGVGRGDDVLVNDLTFIAPVNAIRYVGARPVLVDAQPCDWGMNVLAANRWHFEEPRDRPCAVLPVDLLGHPHNSIRLNAGFVTIEDATEALGATVCGHELPDEADLACFSFNANKIITGAGGGMLVTDNAEWAARARYLINQAKDEGCEFYHGEVGFNYRISNVQAAIALAQFERLDDHLGAKRKLAARYAEGLGDLPGVTLMPKAEWAEPSYWLYTILTRGDSRPLMRALHDEGIEARPIFKPIHLQPPYADCARIGGEMAQDLWLRALSLPSSVGLTTAQQDRVIMEIRRFVGGDA